MLSILVFLRLNAHPPAKYCLFCCAFRVIIGYDEGTIMVKIGREEPVASMDNNGKVIRAKHNEI